MDRGSARGPGCRPPPSVCPGLRGSGLRPEFPQRTPNARALVRRAVALVVIAAAHEDDVLGVDDLDLRRLEVGDLVTLCPVHARAAISGWLRVSVGEDGAPVWRAAVPRTPQSLETRVSHRVTVDLDEILARVEAREACWPPP